MYATRSGVHESITVAKYSKVFGNKYDKNVSVVKCKVEKIWD